ncbi:MAG: hypothetical protein OEZ16_03805 [Chromatiales bacterium]|nr:hypothetical protein [Chromatiales bacterium]
MRILLKVVLFILLLPIIYLVVINLLPDEELSAGAKEWLKPEPITVPKDQNSYYLLWGLDAPVGVDMREYGEARVARIGEVEASGAGAASDYMPAGYKESDLIKTKGVMELCSPINELCLERYQRDGMKVLQEGVNPLLLDRYRQLIAQPHYQRVSPHGLYTPIVPLGVLRASHRLHLMALVSRYQQGNRAETLEQLAQLMRFNRMLITKSDILIDRMIALTLLGDTLHTYSQLLESELPSDKLRKEIDEISELNPDETSFESVLRGELRFMANSLDTALKGDDSDFAEMVARGSLPINHNRIINRAYQNHRRVSAMVSSPPSEILQKSAEIRAEVMVDHWGYLRDPLTSFLIDIGSADLSQYILKHKDLNALIRLLKLKAQIKKEGVSKENIDAFIASSPYASAYPDEMAPVRWEPGEQALIFGSAMGEKANKRNRIFFQPD